MVAGALLFIWIGAGNSQALAVDHFASMAECQSARRAIIAEWGEWRSRASGDCLPYEFTESLQ